MFADLRRYDWEPEGTCLMVGIPWECTPIMYRDFAPNVDPDLINRSSDLVNRFRLLCMCGGDDVSLLCVSLGLFDRACHNRHCRIWEFWLSQVFALMYLDRLYLQKVTQFGPVRA